MSFYFSSSFKTIVSSYGSRLVNFDFNRFRISVSLLIGALSDGPATPVGWLIELYKSLVFTFNHNSLFGKGPETEGSVGGFWFRLFH